MRFKRGARFIARVYEVLVTCATGLAILFFVGVLQDTTPFGDDAIYYVGSIKTFTSSFPFIAWNPHTFAGYVPTIGLSWLVYLPTLLLNALGLDAVISFHFAFLASFLLFGLSVYFFARSLGAAKVVAFSMSLLGWSTNAYWNITIWGGAYDRAFALPFMFIALSMTYRYASRLNAGGASRFDYWVTLATWAIAYFGDVFIAIAATMVGVVFLSLSAGLENLVTGVKRVAAIFLPTLGISLWQIIPIALQANKVGPYRVQFAVANDWAALFVPGATWASTLNFVYVPMLLFCSIICYLVKPRTSLCERALMVSSLVAASYWFILGWVPVLWPYLPRLMATNSSIENLSWIFLLITPLLINLLANQLRSLDRSRLSRVTFGLHCPVDVRRIGGKLGVFALLFVVADALIVLPGIRPVNWEPLTNQLNSSLDAIAAEPSGDYRFSLQNRILTRSFDYYHPAQFQTGGRLENLDPNPFFNNWYATDVFYKNDFGSIDANYFDDRPWGNVSSLLESPSNFAGEKFWLDWYGVNAAVFFPYSYLYNTIGNYSIRPSLFSVVEQPTSYPASEFVVTRTSPGTVMTVTNSTVVGFYSSSADASQGYQSLISILSQLGLDSRFIVPLALQSTDDVLTSPINVLVTDSWTYSHQVSLFETLSAKIDVVVASSSDASQGPTTITQRQGGGSVIVLPYSMSRLLSEGETGAFYFVKSTGLIPMESYGSTSTTHYPSNAENLSPSSWTEGYKTTNAYGSLQNDPNSVILNLTSNDLTRPAQLNIQSVLPDLVPLSGNLTITFSVQTTEDIGLGILFGSSQSCCPNYVAVDRDIKAGSPVQLQFSFSQFKKWGDITHMFGIAHALAFAINLKPGQAMTSVRFSNVSLHVPTFTVSTIARNLSLSDNGIVDYDVPGAVGIALMDESNSSTAVLNLGGEKSMTTFTLASFAGGQVGERYDEIVTIGEGQAVPSEILFPAAVSSSVRAEWINNENIEVASVPSGFRGIVWKETYSSLWSFTSESNKAQKPYRFYYAGPGMIYLPNPPDSLRASFVHIGFISSILFSIPFATLAILTLSRRRLLNFGKQA